MEHAGPCGTPPNDPGPGLSDDCWDAIADMTLAFARTSQSTEGSLWRWLLIALNGE